MMRLLEIENESAHSMRKISEILALLLFALALLAGPAAVAEESGLSTQQKLEIEKLIRDYIDAHPEVIIQSIQKMQAREEQEQKDRAQAALVENKGELVRDPDTPFAGNPKGDVTIVEFFDYRCGFCKRVFPAIMKVLNDDPNIRYVFKEFPILGPESVTASRAALAVWRTDKSKYAAFHSALMTARGDLAEAKVRHISAGRGMDAGKIKKAMADPAIDTLLERNYRLAQALNINGTPAFVIGDQLAPGAIDIAQMKKMIAEARGS